MFSKGFHFYGKKVVLTVKWFWIDLEHQNKIENQPSTYIQRSILHDNLCTIMGNTVGRYICRGILHDIKGY